MLDIRLKKMQISIPTNWIQTNNAKTYRQILQATSSHKMND